MIVTTKTINSILFALMLSLLLWDISLAKNEAETREQSFTLSTKEIMMDVAGPPAIFPLYTTQLINLANQNSQATRARNVGQMSELMQEFPGNSYEQWVRWYIEKNPDAIDRATDKTFAMIVKMRQAMAEIEREMVGQWIRELILAKTYAGLRFQESILKTIAEKNSTTYRLARPDEESKGIDGFIGIKPVSIKPVSYQSKTFLPETIDAKIIYYEKVRGGITFKY